MPRLTRRRTDRHVVRIARQRQHRVQEALAAAHPVPEFESQFGLQNYGARADNMEAVAVLIMPGRYCGFLPAHFAEPYVKPGLLQPLDTDELAYRVTIHTCVRKASRRSDVIEAFMSDLRAAIEPP